MAHVEWLTTVTRSLEVTVDTTVVPNEELTAQQNENAGPGSFAPICRILGRAPIWSYRYVKGATSDSRAVGGIPLPVKERKNKRGPLSPL